MKQPLLAYNGNRALRRRLLEEIAKHEKADAIMQGTYGMLWKGQWRGCAIGCSLRSLNLVRGEPPERDTGIHTRYVEELGIPLELAYLEDRLFERLPLKKAKTWPRRFASAIRAGADLTLVWSQFAHWLLVDDADGVIWYAVSERTRAAILGAAALLERRIAGGTVTLAEWRKAESAASAAFAAAVLPEDRHAAGTAEQSASPYSTDVHTAGLTISASAATTTATAAATAATAAAKRDALFGLRPASVAAAAETARKRSLVRQANKLIELLKAAPVRRAD